MPTPGDAAEENTGTPRSLERDESPMVNEVFSMFKTYLESKLDEKTKQLESKSKLDKQVTQMKFKGNQKQFELNAQIDSVFDRIRSANDSKNNQVDDLVDEGKELIRKRQKLIRIADKSADGWKVVDEYVSDELASGSEDEKRLKKAKEAASRKRGHPTQGRGGPGKKLKGILTSTDQQLFRCELACVLIFFLRSLSFCLIFFGVLCLFSRLLGFARDPPISDFAWFLRLFKR